MTKLQKICYHPKDESDEDLQESFYFLDEMAEIEVVASYQQMKPRIGISKEQNWSIADR